MDKEANKKQTEENEQEKKQGISRRMLAGIAVGAVVASVTGTKSAYAEGVSDAKIAADMTALLAEVKSIYEQGKEWIGDWNSFVGAFNQSMKFAQDAYKMMTDPKDNIFYQQFKQMVDYVDTQLNKGGNFLDYRLDYLYPVLFEKIDSMVVQTTNLAYRWKNLEMVKYMKENVFTNQDDPVHQANVDKKFNSSNVGKTIRRVSNDTADYGVTRAKVHALQDVSDSMKKSIINMPLNPGPPKNGEAPQKSRGQVFQELSAPLNTDIQLEQLRLLNEISMKLTNLILITSKVGEPPIVADNEQMVTSDQMRRIIQEEMAKATSSLHADTAILSSKK